MLPLAVTMGEPAGIGGEITLKAWLSRGDGVPPFYLIDDPQRIAALARRLGVPFADADAFHPAANIAKMAAGRPLTDDDYHSTRCTCSRTTSEHSIPSPMSKVRARELKQQKNQR